MYFGEMGMDRFVVKKFEVRRGHTFYVDDFEFKSPLQELLWKLSMMRKGCKLKKIKNNRR
ncbi:hypothetical protein HMPREF1982_00801 [Clostridiales bacterium oral taxon 876 str. F0540]|nr:hypothetical protein HMPREF1982_00801 [Clostridiales bacterium oral taxon 876 str. F0540]